MGANTFVVSKIGIYRDVREAFFEAVEDANYEFGHGGYTGTIAEKNNCQSVELPKGKEVGVFITECLDNENGFWNDKWGPAAYIEIKGAALSKYRGERFKGKRNFKVFYFFGWASS